MKLESTSSLMKAIIVAAVAVFLLIPLQLLRNLVTERTQMRAHAVQQVAQGWGGPQLLGGPVLAIPVTTTDTLGHTTMRDWYVLPDSLAITTQINVLDERRKVGIYEVPVYTATLRASGTFDAEREITRLVASDSGVQAHIDRARLLVPVRDPRGLRNISLTDNGVTTTALEPARGFPIPVLTAPAPVTAGSHVGKRQFSLTVELAGTESLAFLQLARSVQARVSGNWPHPGFTQGFLPVERSLEPGRFDARWQVLDVNRSYGGQWFQGDLSAADLEANAFGVELVQPVDLYQRAERAVKYAGLFISLSLLTLFLWEQFMRQPLHPIQYGLTGLALSVFYLLLLALSEHIGFERAYLLAAVALCALLGIYLAGALRSGKSGFASGGCFAGVYALLYLLVTSESYSLLAGSIALFGLLTAVMILTRKLDWYFSGSPTQSVPVANP